MFHILIYTTELGLHIKKIHSVIISSHIRTIYITRVYTFRKGGLYLFVCKLIRLPQDDKSHFKTITTQRNVKSYTVPTSEDETKRDFDKC